MKSVFITMLVVICFVAAMIFSANNTALVNINYFVAQGDFNISHVIGFAFLLGFIICWLIFLSFYITLKFQLRSANKKLARLETSLEKDKTAETDIVATTPANV